MKTNATQNELQTALDRINQQYENNIIFNNFEQKTSKVISFTLRVKDAKCPGHRLGMSTTSKGNHRRLINACWHVHGELFDALFDLNPHIYVRAGDKKITKDFGNWEDRNIGSNYQPMYFSEACDCS